MKVFMFEYPVAEWDAYVKRRKWLVTDPESGATFLQAPDMVIDAASDGTTVTVNVIAETKRPITAAMWDYAVLPEEPMRVFAGHDETPFESADDMPAATRTRVQVVDKLERRAERKAQRLAERLAEEQAKAAEEQAKAEQDGQVDAESEVKPD